ncbi:ExbD/TolR family protein [Aliikangiella maris]|uniref:Biopolymer transporter ExbD n=2 Tax=Aliikangiella maris TaxID=3162458 RepID=A0ABV2BVF5_9GAMM
MMNNLFHHNFQLSGFRRANPKNIDDQLTPLINIVFLLLIFFIFAGQIEPQSKHEIELPTLKNQHHTQQLDNYFLMTLQGELYYNDKLINKANIQHILKKQTAINHEVIIKADKKITAQKLAPLLRELNTGSFKVRFVVIGKD